MRRVCSKKLLSITSTIFVLNVFSLQAIARQCPVGMENGNLERRRIYYVGWKHKPFRKSNLIKCEKHPSDDVCGDFKQSKGETLDVRSKEGKWARFELAGSAVLCGQEIIRRGDNCNGDSQYEYKYLPDQQLVLGQLQVIYYFKNPQLTSKMPVKLSVYQKLRHCTTLSF